MSDAQLDTIIEKLDKIIEQIMLGGVTEGIPWVFLRLVRRRR